MLATAVEPVAGFLRVLWFVLNRTVLSSVEPIGVRLLLRFVMLEGLHVDLAVVSPDIEHFAVLFVDDYWRVNDVTGRSSAVRSVRGCCSSSAIAGVAQSLSIDRATRGRTRVVVRLQWPTEHGSLLSIALLLTDQALNAGLFVTTDSLAHRLPIESEWEKKKEREMEIRIHDQSSV